MAEQRTGRMSLTVVTAVTAALLGLLAGSGGFGLALALVSSHQPPDQILTACALALAGSVNVIASRGIYRERGRPILLSGIVTLGLMGYLAAAVRDFGEMFWLHALYLVLLATLHQRRHAHVIIAA